MIRWRQLPSGEVCRTGDPAVETPQRSPGDSPLTNLLLVYLPLGQPPPGLGCWFQTFRVWDPEPGMEGSRALSLWRLTSNGPGLRAPVSPISGGASSKAAFPFAVTGTGRPTSGSCYEFQRTCCTSLFTQCPPHSRGSDSSSSPSSSQAPSREISEPQFPFFCIMGIMAPSSWSCCEDFNERGM